MSSRCFLSVDSGDVVVTDSNVSQLESLSQGFSWSPGLLVDSSLENADLELAVVTVFTSVGWSSDVR